MLLAELIIASLTGVIVLVQRLDAVAGAYAPSMAVFRGRRPPAHCDPA